MRAPDLPCPAPDRSPRTPRTRLPFGACDTHAHICGPAAAFPYADERIYTPPDSTLEDYLHLLDVLGIDRAVLVQPSVYGTDNRALLDALSRRGQGLSRRRRRRSRTYPSAEIRALDDAGIRGVRFNLVDHTGERNVVPLDVVRTLANAIAPFGWHIEFLVNLDEAPRLRAGDLRAAGGCRGRASRLSAQRRRRLGRARRASTRSCACSRPAAAGSS